MNLFDTHAHLDQEEFSADLSEVIMRARSAGVRNIVCVGTNVASSRAAVDIAARHDLFAAVGVHPNCCADANPADLDALVDLVQDPRVVAIGETGLDRYWNYAPIEQQRDWFARHVELACRYQRPLIVHCREAEADVLQVVRVLADRHRFRGVMHSFSGSPQFAEQCLELGFYLSFSGSVTYTNKKFAPLHAAARICPRDRLLVETDSPYLVPQPLRGRLRRNEPAWIIHIIERLAVIRGEDAASLAAATAQNAHRLFFSNHESNGAPVLPPD